MNLRNGKVYESYESPVKRSYNTRYQMVKIKSEPTTYYEHEAATSMVSMFDGQNPSNQQSTVVSKRQWTVCKPEYEDAMDIKPKIESIYITSPPVGMESNIVKKIKSEVIEEEFMEFYRDNIKGENPARHNQLPRKKAVPVRNEYALPSNKTYSCYLCGKSFLHHCRLKVTLYDSQMLSLFFLKSQNTL